YSNVWAGGQVAPAEMDRFGPAGRALVVGQWSQVFADDGVQAGPFQLVPHGLIALLHPSGTVPWTLLYLAYTALTTALFLAGTVPTRDAVRRWARYAPLGVGAAVTVGNLVPWAQLAGHPAQVMIPALWVLAGRAARRGRSGWCGVLVGLASGWEVWGVLGAPVVLCAARPRLLRAAVAAGSTVLLLYGPFVLSGSFAMFEKEWSISGRSLVHLLRPEMQEYPWSLRLLQAGLAVAVGVSTALLTRRSVYAPWLVPLAVLAARLVADPLLFDYYWIAPAVTAAALVGASTVRGSVPAVTCTAPLAVWLWTSGSRDLAGAVALLLVTCVMAPVLVSRRARLRPSAAAPAAATT
ncbi:MAG TPA: hypothetical protein VFR56_01270, partial [Actinomycetes bacterium]|nr:hypothetical protein [Actinomycetes bacterium]